MPGVEFDADHHAMLIDSGQLINVEANQDFVAREVAREFRNLVKVVENVDRGNYWFYAWDTNRFKAGGRSVVEAKVRELVLTLSDAFSAKYHEIKTEGKEPPSWVKSGYRFYRAARTGNFYSTTARMMHLFESLRCDITDFNRSGIVTCANVDVALDCNTGEYSIHAPNPDHMSTRSARYHYKQGATFEPWQKYLESTYVDEQGNTDHDYIDFIQRLGGYLLTGTMRQEEIIFWLLGAGENGKNVLVETLSYHMADYSQSVELNALMGLGDHALEQRSTLSGKLLALATEGESLKYLEPGKYKALVDKFAPVRPMYGSHYDMDITYKVLIATNVMPCITDASHAMRRRTLVLPFNATFDINNPNRVDNLKELLETQEAGSAILNWQLEGFKKYCERGLRRDVPLIVQRETDRYFDFEMESTPAGFLNQYFERTPGTHTNLQDMYDLWQHVNRDSQLGKKTFGKRVSQCKLEGQGMEAKVATSVTGRRERCWLDVSPKGDLFVGGSPQVFAIVAKYAQARADKAN